MGAQQPYLYDPQWRDSRLPEKPFDPKAITRASWEPKPKKPKQKGPLISFGRHPDAQAVLAGRTIWANPMSGTTKWWIKFTRYIQLCLRGIEMIGGVGLLVLMILISNVDPLTSWVMRITPGVVAISCVYAIWHFIRPANARPPASSAAYQLFAGVMDLAVIPLYAFGVISAVNHGTEWKLIINASQEITDALVKSEYYALIGAGGLHVISLGISVYLCLMFRRIANMPPDMNPLEPNLTSRAKQHKRNKSSVATSYTSVSEDSKRLSTPLENYRSSGAAYEDLSRPPNIPFMHTRANSRDSFASSASPPSKPRDSRTDLPSRQYQITPGNSPRHSLAGSVAELKRLSLPQRATYTEVPLHEIGVASPPLTASRPGSGTTITVGPLDQDQQPTNASPTRVARFTEAWYASESLINRTQERQRALNALERAQRQSYPQTAAAQYQQKSSSPRKYEALNQRYNFDSDDDDASDRENGRMIRPGDSDDDYDDDGDNVQSSPINVTAHLHPNPLRLNPIPIPAPLQPTPPPSNPSSSSSSSPSDRDIIATRQKTPRPLPALAEVSHNKNARRDTSGSRDIADAKRASAPAMAPFWRRGGAGNAGAGMRNSSIQADSDFYAKPYGELKPATPPIMVGGKKGAAGGGGGGKKNAGGTRQVSSGNDYADLGSGAGATWRRNVSGKGAEEGRAGLRFGNGNGIGIAPGNVSAKVDKYSRYSILNED